MLRVKKLTANGAAIMAGFRRKPTPLEKVLKVLPQLTAADRDLLRRKLEHARMCSRRSRQNADPRYQ